MFAVLFTRTSSMSTSGRLRTVTIGTAGHVDHGKSALVRALTGVDPDRLPEERARGMTIVLGFAPLTLPSGQRLNIVDVPGHEALVCTMAQGAQGMALVLFCIDAREGVRAQTREHLDILRLLGIPQGLIVVTKADLVEEPLARLELEQRVYEAVRGTLLDGAPTVWTSSRTHEGLRRLVDELDRAVHALPPRDDAGAVRLPIDRAFTVKGFGCIVTGTLLQGTVRPGQQLTLLPQELPVRVRGLQIHKDDVDEAYAGERPAVNLAGVDATVIAPGSTLVTAGAFRPTPRFLGELYALPTAAPIHRRTVLELLTGTSAVHGWARIGGQRIAPGDTTVTQLRCEAPLVLAHGDVVLIRDVGTSRTIGRVRVLDPHPAADTPRHVACALQAAGSRGEAATTLVAGAGSGGMRDADLAIRMGVPKPALGRLVRMHHTFWTTDALMQAREALIAALPAPGRRRSLEEWRAASPIQDPTVLDKVTLQIVRFFHLRLEAGAVVCPRSPVPHAVPTAAAVPRSRAPFVGAILLARVLHHAKGLGLFALTAPPALAGVGEERLQTAMKGLCKSRRVVELGHAYAIHPDALERLTRRLRLPITVAAAAQALGLSRVQAHAVLGYLLRTGRLEYGLGHYRASASVRKQIARSSH